MLIFRRRKNEVLKIPTSCETVGATQEWSNPERADGMLQNKAGSGLYVDMENIQSSPQELIEAAIDTWPGWFPEPILLSLYVRADQAELWRLWATDRFDTLDVMVRGTQRFSASTSKNSADIAIATNAMADWILGRVSHVAVFSNDSDYISLYASMREQMIGAGEGSNVPFLWVVTNGGGTLSPTAEQFFPDEKLHMVNPNGDAADASASDNGYVSAEIEGPPVISGSVTYQDIARAIIQDIPVGSFKSTDCQDVIRRRWPGHEFVSLEGPQLGQAFKEHIWPMLRVWGVRMTNPSNQSVRYEMTDSAKSRMK